MTFLDVWIGYTVFGVSALSVMLIWAVRNRQFSDLDRGRFIALNADELEEEADRLERMPTRLDWCSPVILVSLVTMSLIAAIWLGMHCR